MIEIYNNFELVSMSPIFTTFMWRRRFSRSGEFEFVTNFTPEMFELFRVDKENPWVVYMRHVDEAAFITSRNVVQTIEGNRRLIVRGQGLSHLLNWRNVTLSGNFSLQALFENIINNNFLDGAGPLRSMSPGVRLLPFSLPEIGVSVDFRNRNAYEAITVLLEEHSLGVRVNYNLHLRVFDIEFYAPVETEPDVVFSKMFANIIEQDFFEDIFRYRNVVFVGNGYILNNSEFTGFSRREISVPDTQTWRDALWTNRAKRTLSSTINLLSKQFEYIKDWNIGSIVTSENREIGFREREIITGITEFYDTAGAHVEVEVRG